MRTISCKSVLGSANYGIVIASVAAAAYQTGDPSQGEKARAAAENAYATVVVDGINLPRKEWERLQTPLRQLRNAISRLSELESRAGTSSLQSNN